MGERLKKFKIILLCINIALLAVFAVLYGVISSLGSRYSSDSAKQLWDSDDRSYAQISLYLTPENGLDIMSVYSLRKSIDEKLVENSVTNDKKNQKGRLWIDAGSGECSTTVTGNMGSCDVTVSGTMGDYFIFHPEKLLSGSYYTDDDINIDRVILDKQCSWQIFGAVDTAGMSVTVGGKVFYVAAVVDSPDSGRDLTAYGSRPRIYMPFSSLKELNDQAVMTSYEVCMPNIVKDFAYTVMTDINPADENSSVVIDQSGRFDIVKLFKGFGSIPESVMITANLKYPWYENRTRSAEIIAKILAGPAIYILIIPAVSLVYALFLLAKLAGRGIRAVKSKADRAYQKRISEAYYKKHTNN